jgi:hypothetical protein
VKLAVEVNIRSVGAGAVPRSVGAGTLAAWYRADKGITISTGVSQWNDLSGKNRHLTQATGTKQPLYIASAIAGKPAVRFDGSDDFLGPVAFTLNQPETVVLVYKSIVIGAASAHDAIADGNATGNMVVLSDNGTHYSIAAGVALTDAELVNNTVYGYTLQIFNGASSFIFVNGTQKATGNAGANNGGGFTLGALPDGTRSTNIEVAEAIVYASALGAADRSRLTLYIKARYGL